MHSWKKSGSESCLQRLLAMSSKLVGPQSRNQPVLRKYRTCYKEEFLRSVWLMSRSTSSMSKMCPRRSRLPSRMSKETEWQLLSTNTSSLETRSWRTLERDRPWLTSLPMSRPRMVTSSESLSRLSLKETLTRSNSTPISRRARSRRSEREFASSLLRRLPSAPQTHLSRVFFSMSLTSLWPKSMSRLPHTLSCKSPRSSSSRRRTTTRSSLQITPRRLRRLR